MYYFARVTSMSGKPEDEESGKAKGIVAKLRQVDVLMIQGSLAPDAHLSDMATGRICELGLCKKGQTAG